MKKILFLAILLITFNGWASTGGLVITPIIGVESVQKFEPSPHMKSRMIFGALVVYNLPVISFESEYTHAQDSSSDLSATTPTSYKDVEDKLKIGLRGNASFDQYLSTYLRGGAQLRQNKHTKTVADANSTTITQTKVQPYIGTGIAIHVLQYFSLNADITAVYAPTSTAGLKNFELAPSIGFTLGI